MMTMPIYSFVSPVPSTTMMHYSVSSNPYKRRATIHSHQPLSAVQPPYKRTYRSRRKQQLRRVSFSTSSSLYIVTNLTIEHKPDLWLTHDEIQRTKRKTEVFAYLLRSKRINRHDFDSAMLMGLEKHLPDESIGNINRSKRPRQELLSAVLEEQHRQNLVGVQDVEALATISRRISQRARDQATVIGVLQSL